MDMVRGSSATSSCHVEQALVSEFEKSVCSIFGLFIVSGRSEGIGETGIGVTMDETVSVFG
jgi:hypothetical protein